MTIVIVLLVVAVLVVAVGFALNPILNAKRDAAQDAAISLVGADDVVAVEVRATGYGTDPLEAGGLDGMGCLAASSSLLAFVTWAPHKHFQISRAAITAVAVDPEGASETQKATITVAYSAVDGSPVSASWRLPTLGEWFKELVRDIPANDQTLEAEPPETDGGK